MSVDLKLGLLRTLYATWLHNHLAVGLILAMGICALALVMRPKRRLVFFFLGFLLLFLQFEYQKHLGPALEEQTIASVIIEGEHWRAREVMEDFFQKLVPFAFWVGGWSLVFLGLVV
jgi:hypothetical protein